MPIKYVVQTDCGIDIPVHVSHFPSGEVAVKLEVDADKPIEVNKVISVMVQGYEPDELFILANIKDALDEMLRNAGASHVQIRLLLAFMPHARYDRHMVTGDGFALRVFCDMVNLLKFDSILVIDPHSDATTAMLRNATSVPQDKVMGDIIQSFGVDCDVLVAPDAGAYKKIFTLAKQLKKPVVCLSKVRDLETGNIIGTALLNTLPEGAKCLVIDDLCDGGRTFIGAAETLREHGAVQVDLAITHGIFSAGLNNLLDNGIDHLYCTDSFKDLGTEGWEGKVNQYKYF